MKTILEMLEQTAGRIPERIAVEDQNTAFTWGELLEQAQRAGSCLAECQTAGSPVVLMVEKSARAAALLYGVLYSGSSYVFVDPAQPMERVKKILHTTGARIVVVDRDAGKQKAEKQNTGTPDAEKMDAAKPDAGNMDVARADTGAGKDDSVQVLYAEEVLNHAVCRPLLESIRTEAKETDLLYTVFTSGSTGDPKGIAVSHRAVIDFIRHFTEETGIRPDDVIGNQAPFDFDVSVKDIFSSCFTGAKLVLIPRTFFAMPGQLVDYLIARKITVLIWAVSALCMISQFGGFDYRTPVSLRMVMFSGEVMPFRQLRIWQDALPDTRFINLYGPSEITCNCTYFRIPEHYQREILPIGVPFAGRKVFLRDDAGRRITQADKPGEICVGGESLAEGYLHDPLRTAQAFLDGEDGRYYRTGDIGYLGFDGLFYFVGRRDSQIKHMGHRIELGEVENAMLKVPGIQRACCIFDRSRNRICGFYQGEVQGKAIREYLKKEIPGYMVPGRLIKVDCFRLNDHGKIDRKQLMEEIGA
ncbi:MAG: amino acid adenylation domain-containing protein [Eubacterium sp.]|nr:amino acid adenylation domain-containing protein [Eubacterium sp.]